MWQSRPEQTADPWTKLSEGCSCWLQVGYPDRAVAIGRTDAGLLVVIALSSFFGQMLLNRSFQIIPAAKGSSIMCTQVHTPSLVQQCAFQSCSLLWDVETDTMHHQEMRWYSVVTAACSASAFASKWEMQGRKLSSSCSDFPGTLYSAVPVDKFICGAVQVLYAHIFGVLLGDQETLWGLLGAALIACGVVSVNRAKSGLPAPGSAKQGPSLAGRGDILYTPLAWQGGHSSRDAAVLAHVPAAPAEASEDAGSIAALRHERQVLAWTIPSSTLSPNGGIMGGKRNTSSTAALHSSRPQGVGLELQERSLSRVDEAPLASSSIIAGTQAAGKPYSGRAKQEESGVPVEAAALQLPLGGTAQPAQGVCRQGRMGAGRGQTLRDREQSWTGEWVFEGKKAVYAPGTDAPNTHIED